MSAELKACPFCGARPVVQVHHKYTAFPFKIACTHEDCDVSPVAVAKTRGEVVERWNTRQTP